MTRGFVCGTALLSAALAAQLALATGAPAAARAENRFGSITIDGKKAGQVHYTVEYGDDGAVETLKTRASLSILGIKLFNFEQNLHEVWHQGALQTLNGRTNDDGTIYDAALGRAPDGYRGTLNQQPVEVPGDAFPASVWHYAITGQSLLFDLKTLELMQVRIARSNETIEVDKLRTPTERFDLTGDWRASLWFDQDRQLVKVEDQVDSPKGVIQLQE